MNTYNAHSHIERMIKVCGMADADNIRQVGSLTPMLMGFIFYEKSPRYAGNLPVEAVASLPDFVNPVAVFVDASIERITEICGRYGIKIVQLHGNESPELCRQLRRLGYTVLKAFGLDESVDWQELAPYDDDAADLFVFDTKTAAHGGSGIKFDWSLLDSYPLETPYLLGGGIGPDDTEAVISAMRPKMAGVDINSRFETSPGVKDIRKITHFILSLRKHNENESLAIPFWTKKQ